ncbi:MAG TPA: MBL fold metallo-hydrolase [Acidobacteriota bacterium]|nr:MBL fold metallo-hydrolase [Acidobacteriota bacterium]
MLFRQINDPKLAQYAYLIGCQATGEAIVIDPERDIDRYVEAAEAEDLTITAVAETHIHADFLSGAREFADRLGVKLYVSDEGDEDWKYEWLNLGDYQATLLKDGQTFEVGKIEFKALHTPGHTPEHLSYLVTDRGGGAGQPMGIASGDFVFVGDLGRPDLLETAAKVEGAMKPSAQRLYDSVQQFLHLPEFLQIWPAHGAGSACGKALGAVPMTTAGYETRFSPAIEKAKEGEDAFVEFILKDQPEPPFYFARMKRDNKNGVPLLGDLPRPRRLTAKELKSVVQRRDALIVDARPSRSDFMARHLPGSLYAPLKIFNTAVGSMVEDETTPLYLIIDEDRLEGAVRDLVRIGYDNLPGFADPSTLERYFQQGGKAGSIEEVDISALDSLRQRAGSVVLDVRTGSEFEAGHVTGARNASYTRLPEYRRDIPGDKTLLVHCASGRRASAAASYLSRLGRRVVYVNGHFDKYAEAAGVKSQSKVSA